MRIRKRGANSRSPTSSSFTKRDLVADAEPLIAKLARDQPGRARFVADVERKRFPRRVRLSGPLDERAPAQCRRMALPRARFRFRMTRRSATRRWRSSLLRLRRLLGPRLLRVKGCARDGVGARSAARHSRRAAPRSSPRSGSRPGRRTTGAAALVVIVDGIAPGEIEVAVARVDRPAGDRPSGPRGARR